MTWRALLHEYVRLRNEVEGTLEGWRSVRSFVYDEGFVEAEEGRLTRSQQLRRERSLTPVQHETRLKILKVQEGSTRVVIDIEMSKQFTYTMQGSRQLEEKMERERLTLERSTTGKWVMMEVAPYIGDHDSMRSFYSDFSQVPFIETDVSTYSQVPARGIIYDREAARQYAETWWNSYNPAYLEFEVDCTNFVSQCLFAGHAPMHYTGKRETGWWFRGRNGSQELWSFSWAVAQSLQLYLGTSKSGLRGIQVDSADKLVLGDVISYSWDGNRFTHSTIVTGFTPDGVPLVNAHTVNSRNRYWDYRDSYAWTVNTIYRFYHIPDVL